MKTLTLITKPLGMAAIAAAVLSANPNTSQLVGSKELASESAEVGTIQAMVGNEKVEVQYRIAPRVGRVYNKETKKFEETESAQHLEATFSVPSYCNSESCLSPMSFEMSQDLADIKGLLASNRTFKSELETLVNETNKKRGDLVKRKKAAENCQIKIINEADKSQDVKLTGKDNRSERFQCLAEKFEEGDYENDREEKSAFKKLFDKDLKELAFSNDEDAQELLSELRDNITSEQAANYIGHVQTVNETHKAVVDIAGRLVSNPNDPQASAELLQLNTMHTFNRFPNNPVSNTPGGLLAVQDYRSQVLEEIRKAFETPSALLSGINDTTAVLAGSTSGRLNRTNMGQMPRVGQAGSTGVQPMPLNRQPMYGQQPQFQSQPYMQQPMYNQYQQPSGAPRRGRI